MLVEPSHPLAQQLRPGLVEALGHDLDERHGATPDPDLP